MGNNRQLLIATTNPGKLIEYQELLDNLPFTLTDLRGVGIDVDVPETGSTFEANARLKALAYAQMSGMLTLADDSGLEVMALGGDPGVLSARYGGPGLDDNDRTQLVLHKLQGVPFHERMARFVCVIAVAEPDGRCETAYGHVGGVIDSAPKGTNGFGYDPIFYLLDRGVTMAELPRREKNHISHRAQAAQGIRPILLHWCDHAR
jgi:XTP/dITP diphosphohydrolase